MVAGELDAEQVITLLEPAVASGVVSEDEIAWQWRFSHALVQETLVAGLSRLAAARLHARLARALEDRGSRDVERLAHHCFAAGPSSAPSRPAATPPPRRSPPAGGSRHPEAAAPTRRALSLLEPTELTAAARHDLLVALGDDLLRSGHLQSAQEVVGSRSSWRARPATPAASRRRPASGAASRCGTGGRTASSDTALVALLQDLADRRGRRAPGAAGPLLGTSGSSWPTATTAPPAWPTPTGGRHWRDPRRPGAARAHPQQRQPRGLGSVDRVERRLAATDEALTLAGPGPAGAHGVLRAAAPRPAAPAPGRRRRLLRRPARRPPGCRRR
jgi:hypothetical protein